MAFRWRADGDPTLNAALVFFVIFGDPDQNCKENLFFQIFRWEGGGKDPLSRPLDPTMVSMCSFPCFTHIHMPLSVYKGPICPHIMMEAIGRTLTFLYMNSS